MRTIKFRAWDRIKKEMIKGESLCIGLTTLGHDINNRSNWEFQQYTGLKDKFDNEIYEGDIIKVWNYEYTKIVEEIIAKVIWFDHIACFMYLPIYINEDEAGIENCEILNHRSQDFEVIGNINENPELIG